MIKDIPLDKIRPSPFQHRRYFDKTRLEELAANIRSHGLIQPITVREVNRHYELVCGERRWKAAQIIGTPTIAAFVREYTDKQARIVCLSENVQRTDLSSVERIAAVAEWVDAYLDENAEGYRKFLAKQLKGNGKRGRRYKINGKPPDLSRALHRVAYLLTLVESDRKNKTEYSDNFVAKLNAAFDELNQPVQPDTFANHDMPLLLRLEEVEEVRDAAIEKALNKQQAEALLELAEAKPKMLREILEQGLLTPNGYVALEELSSREIRAVAAPGFMEMAHVGRNSGEEEWYTPEEYLDAAREVLGEIDIDPASSTEAQKRVKAKRYHTMRDDGLTKDWSGNVWMNPPYTDGLVDRFVDKLCGHYEASDVKSAIVLVNNCTETKWFQRAAKIAVAICFPAGRIRFIDRHGKPSGAPLQGQALLYLGKKPSAFGKAFGDFGTVWTK